MKLVAEYLTDAVKLEHLAAVEKNPEVRTALEQQAAAYRKLAEKRAKATGIPLPEKAE